MIVEKLCRNESDVLKLIEGTLTREDREFTLQHQSSSRETPTSNCLKLTYFNQHCFNIYNSNIDYKNLLDNSFEVFLDGIGIYFVLKMSGYKNVQRFNATDLNEKIFNHFSKIETRLFLIGGKFDKEFISQNAAVKKINVVGYQNGYFENQDISLIVDEINQSFPEVIVIAMGVPKQEILAEKLALLINAKLIICVGGFLEFYFGTKPRSPKIFRVAGLEWLYRMINEPSRLWKRYLIGIPLFLFNVSKYSIKLKSERSH